MSNIFYGEKSINEIDEYYKIIVEETKKSKWYDTKLKECKKIQSAFNTHNINLALQECANLYETWSDEKYCSGWEDGLEDMTQEEIYNMLIGWLNVFIYDKIKRLEVLCNELKLVKDKS